MLTAEADSSASFPAVAAVAAAAKMFSGTPLPIYIPMKCQIGVPHNLHWYLQLKILQRAQ